MNQQKYNQILEELRQLWRDGKLRDLRKKYLLCAWLLTPEDRKKIEEVIGQQFYKEGKQDELITFAEEELGYKIIDKN